jgi:hypothetical protein
MRIAQLQNQAVKKILVGIIVLVVLIAAGYFYISSRKTANPTEAAADIAQPSDTSVIKQVVKLTEQNNSSESGTAVLSEKDGKVIVKLELTGVPAGASQPAHIHAGNCQNIGAVGYSLANVVNGKSVTDLDIPFSQLTFKQPLAINIHKSDPEAKTYIACGDLTLPTPSPADTATASASVSTGD